MTTVATHVIDVTEQTFATEVLQRSASVPVVVDFWAEWCGPCRMLGPVLERLAGEYDGAFILAKLDVDQNPRISQQFQIQGIPAVKAFRNGRVVDEFTGALPEPQVRQFIDGLAPSPADISTQEGNRLEANGQATEAVAQYQAALAAKADHFPAMLGLGRTLLRNGQVDSGLSILEKIPAAVPERPEAEALIATVQFQQFADGQEETELRQALEADATDVPSRYALASLLATQGNYEEALEQFLEVVRRDRQYEEDGARQAMLALFNIVGEADPLTKSYRQKLASALF